MPKHSDTDDQHNLRDRIVGLGESSGRKSYYPMLQQKIRELQAEIDERAKAEHALHTTVLRIARQQEAIACIATHPAVFHGLLEEAAPLITEQMAKAMQIKQSGIWLFEKSTLVCIDSFDTESEKHDISPEFVIADYPRYFHSISTLPYIDASDAQNDPRTCEFSSSYLEPGKVRGLLDVPVYLGSELVGIICFEHSGEKRIWQADEITFACRIADHVALILAGQRRRIAEEKLRDAHSSLHNNYIFTQTLLNAIPIPVFYKDADLHYLGCNRSFSEFMGLEESFLIGKTTHDIWPDLAQHYAEADRQLLENPGSQLYESRVRNNRNEMRDVIFAKQVFHDAHNQSRGIIGSFLDITDKNTSAQENTKLRSLLSNIINSMPSVLVGVDACGEIAQWNQQAAHMTGLTEKEVLGKPLQDVIPWLCNEMDKIREAIKSRQTLFQGKLARQSHGETLYEDMTIYPLVTNGVEGAVIRIDDITDRIRIEEMLVQSEKMLSVGGLAAGMAHEINNPLASILGNIQVVESRLTKPLPRNLQAAKEAGISFDALTTYIEQRGIPKMLKAVHASGAQAAQIVTNMLSFSRKSESQFMPEDIVTLLDKTLHLAATDYDLKKNYDFKKITIIRKYEPNLPQIHCSASKLQQVILNLLRNGAEAMGDKNYAFEHGPQFIIKAHLHETWLRIEIEDNGSGMDESTRKRVFEPFFTTKPLGKGTGLGLSVSYFIITEGHGGRMSVQTIQGAWTRFIIDLPLVQ